MGGEQVGGGYVGEGRERRGEGGCVKEIGGRAREIM